MLSPGFQATELEGAGADRRARGRGVVGALGHHIDHAHHGRQDGQRLAGDDLDRGGVDRLGGELRIAEHLLPRQAVQRRQRHAVQRVDHVGGGEGLAVLELHPLAQLEPPGGGIDLLPRDSKSRLDRAVLRADLGQRFDYVLRQHPGDVACRRLARLQTSRLGIQDDLNTFISSRYTGARQSERDREHEPPRRDHAYSSQFSSALIVVGRQAELLTATCQLERPPVQLRPEKT